MELLETTIVLVTPIENGSVPFQFNHVPSLDFLIRNNVIKYNGDWESDDIFVTDQMSPTISFKNKIEISADLDRLKITQNMTVKNDLDDLRNISIKILSKLDKVTISGCGINFLAVRESDSPEEEIKKQFFSNIPKLPHDDIISGSLSYSYMMDGILVTDTILPVQKTNPLNPKKGVSMRANYHLDNKFPKKIEDYLQTMGARKNDFLNQIKAVFG